MAAYIIYYMLQMAVLHLNSSLHRITL